MRLGPIPAAFALQARGKLLHDRTVYVGPRVKSAMGITTPGHVIITPLQSAEWQRTVLVNRGWAPDTWRSGLGEEGEEGVVEVSGVLRRSEQPNRFVPDNKPGDSQWFWIDAPSIAEHCGLPADTPMMEVFEGTSSVASAQPPTPMEILARRASSTDRHPPPNGASTFPKPNATGDLVRLAVMPEDHRNYAIIWFSLSAITGAMALRVLGTKISRPRR